MRTKGFLTKTTVFLLWILCLAIFIVPEGRAQARGEIRGSVIDAVKEEPIPYAQVLIVGTTKGSITDYNGRYVISKVPPGTYSLQARFIGFRSQTKEVEVSVDATVTVDFGLSVTAITMDEIVVTGTAVETERRALGNTISTVSVRELGDVPVSSLSEVLQGRTPGLVSLPSSGQAGSGASLRVRGMTSVSMSNEPVIYIDGVRVDNYQGETFFTTGGQRPSRINDISPSDIDRVEVIKGASATTLYGTEASSGVIQIFTKQGTRGAPRFKLQHQRGWIRLPEFDYGQLKVTQSLLDSLGRKYPNVNIAQEYPNLKVGSDPANSLVRTAPYEAWEGSIRGGSDITTYYVSGRYENELGSLPSNHYRRVNFRANLDANVTERLKLEARTGYVNNYLRRPNNDNNIFGLMGNAYLANLYNARPGRPWGEAFTALDVSEKLKSEQIVHRFTGSFTMHYRPIGTWTHRLTGGIDAVNEEDTQLFPWRVGFPMYPDGRKYNHRRTNTRITLDYVSAYTQKLSEQFSGQILGGFQGFFDTEYTATARGDDFPAPGLETVSAAASTDGWEYRQKVVNAGYFFQGQLGWKERAYLTAGMRADGNSAFGEEFGLEYYPKVGLSYIISEENFWPTWNNMKLRVAYGTAGKQPGAFDAERTWSPIAALAGIPAVTPGNLGQENLKPEKSHEMEFGFDVGFFDDR
ncbi:MAG: TonB-dependent receptor, partial [bacterium]|nr:TonB-dependent receptor [bacterium]